MVLFWDKITEVILIFCLVSKHIFSTNKWVFIRVLGENTEGTFVNKKIWKQPFFLTALSSQSYLTYPQIFPTALGKSEQEQKRLSNSADAVCGILSLHLIYEMVSRKFIQLSPNSYFLLHLLSQVFAHNNPLF